MPNSRKRRKKPGHQRPRSGNPATAARVPDRSTHAPYEPGPASPTPESWADIRASWRAECEGDVVTALRHHERVPGYRGSPHHGLLRQLVELADQAPPWGWGRWAVYLNGRQALGDDEDVRHHRALERTLLTMYADVCHSVLPGGQDPEMFVYEVIGNDWVYRQLRTYEYGGLHEFLEHPDGARLVARADAHLAAWVDARVGAFRLDERPGSGVLVTDLATDREVRVLDLGAELVTDPGGCVLGRLVPIDDQPGLMFESRPLEVDAQTAREVAALDGGEPTDAWVEVLARARGEGRLGRGFSQTVVTSIVTDVDPIALLAAGTHDDEIAATVARLKAGKDEVGYAALRLLSAAWLMEVRAGPDPACMPLLAAAILQPGVFDRVRAELTQSHRSSGWAWCASLVPEPARGRFLTLADLSEQAQRSA